MGLAQAIAYKLLNSHKVQALFPTVVGVETNRRAVALTFDDGPSPEWTPRLLDLLQHHGAKATFFVVGRNVTAHPDVTLAIVRHGHQLGNHTYSHPDLRALSLGSVATELRRCAAAVRQITGRTPRVMRPPYGGQHVGTYFLARALGYEVIHWSAAALDWQIESSDVLAARVLADFQPGAIVLLHDRLESPPDGPIFPSPLLDRSATLAAVSAILEEGRTRGFSFVTVGELLALGRCRRRPWFDPIPPKQGGPA